MIHTYMMKKFKAFFKACRWPLLSGLMIGTTYIPFPPWAVLFCYAPLWLWLDEDAKSPWEAFRGGWVTQFVLTLIGFHWIAYTAKEFGEFPWAVSLVVLILFAAFIHLHIPLSSWIAFQLKKRLGLKGPSFFFATALVFALVERVWPTIFPWHLGYTLLWIKWPLYQWADVIGFAGLSALILLANAWLAWMWQKQDDSRLIFRQGTAMAVLLVLLTLGGLWKKRAWKATDAQLNVLAVQANIGNLEKVYAEQGRGFRETITFKFIALTQDGLTKHPETDLILWPETALPDAPDHLESSKNRLDLISSGLGTFGKPLLTGSYSKELPAGANLSEAVMYNAMFLLDPHGRPLLPPYRKTALLIFGEYLPLSEEFPILLKWLPFISNFGRGHGPMSMDWKKSENETVRLGGQICYEGLFPNFSRGLSEAGAEVLMNVTNDSWFGVPFEPRQHMMMTLARAIEVRRPMVRSTNTGITTAILASGEQLQRSPSNQEWQGLFEVPYKKNPPSTIYVMFGHFDWILLAFALGFILFRAWQATQSQPKGE